MSENASGNDMKAGWQSYALTSLGWRTHKSGLAFQLSILIFHRVSPFNCCLSVVLQLDKEDYPENLQVVFCPDKQRSLEPFTCLDLVLERQQSIILVSDKKKKKLCEFCRNQRVLKSAMQIKYHSIIYSTACPRWFVFTFSTTSDPLQVLVRPSIPFF